MGAEEAGREASPGHDKGEGRRDRRAWPAWRLMQGRAVVYTYPNNYFHPKQPELALAKRFLSVHCEKTHVKALLVAAALPMFLFKGCRLTSCRGNVRGCSQEKRLCSLCMFI